MENKLVIDKRSQQICRLCLEKLTGMDGDEIDCVKIQMLKELSVDVVSFIEIDQSSVFDNPY